MSKMNSLIGFWNSKSTEVETSSFLKPRPPHAIKIRKWENGNNFVNNLEYSKDQGDSIRERGGDRNTRPMSGCYRVSDERLKGPAKCYEKDMSLSKLDKSEKEVLAEPYGDASDKIDPKKPSDRDIDAGDAAIKSWEEKSKGIDRKMKAELFRDERMDLGLKSGKVDLGYPSPQISSNLSPTQNLIDRPSFSNPSSPTSQRSQKYTSNPTTARDKQDKPISPFARFRQLETDQTQSSSGVHSSLTPPMPTKGTNLYRNSSLPASPRPTITHAQMLTTGQSTGVAAARSGSGAKEMILSWVQDKIKDYPIPMTNFSTCWNDGLAFCAIIHVFYPENFDWYALKAENRRDNFTFGFEKAESLAGIYPLLEVEDMVRFKKPDWKCVFTYVQSFYRRFRDGRHPLKSGLTIPAHTHSIESPSDESKALKSLTSTNTFPSIPCHLPPSESPIPSPMLVTKPPQDKNTEEAHISFNSLSNPPEDQPTHCTKATSLSPMTSKMRSKSVASVSDHPSIEEKPTPERKYSFNNPSAIVSFNTRQ